jgi:quercetin dioxygenase-like cupin family protein
MKIINIKDIEKNDVTEQPLFTGGKVETQFIYEEEFTAKKLQVVNVKFAKGARNIFHTHSQEQILIVIEGKGIIANREREYTIAPGMIVIIPAGEEHWHGASRDSTFAHLSVIGQPQEMKITE